MILIIIECVSSSGNCYAESLEKYNSVVPAGFFWQFKLYRRMGE